MNAAAADLIQPDDAAAAFESALTCSTGLAKPTIAFCITLFNENASSFVSGFRALIRSIEHYHLQRASGGDFYTVCIIADGAAHLQSRLVEQLVRLRLVHSAPFRVDDATIHVTQHTVQSLLRDRPVKRDAAASDEERPSMRCIVCVKHRNRGKLHSHHIFFRRLCRIIQPVYCFQLDCGTRLATDGVLHLIDELECVPTTGAAAALISTTEPKFDQRWFVVWQYLDFALQKAISWPFEEATGHLSVVPGQACIIRWSSLCASTGEDDPSASALERYLTGIGNDSAFARLMYLAEDRVIGNEIALASRRQWRVRYVPHAKAVTDACETFPELLRQRRRWRNSSLACRLWIAARWPFELRRADRSLRDKCRYSITVVAQLMMAALDFCAPAQLFALFTVLVAALTTVLVAAPSQYLSGAMLGVVSMDVLLTIVALITISPGAHRLLRLLRPGVALLEIGAFVAAIAIALPPAAAAFLLLPFAGGLIAMVLALSPSVLRCVLTGRLFPLSYLVVHGILAAYAYGNLHDTSWGTKGLTTPAQIRGERSRFLRWRNLAVASWVCINVLLMALAASQRGFLWSQLNPVLEIAALAINSIVSVAVYTLLRRKLAARIGRTDKTQSFCGGSHERT